MFNLPKMKKKLFPSYAGARDETLSAIIIVCAVESYRPRQLGHYMDGIYRQKYPAGQSIAEQAFEFQKW